MRIGLCSVPVSFALMCAAVPLVAREAETGKTAVKWFEKIDMAFGATGIVQGTEGVPRTPENTKADVSGYSHSLDLGLTAPVPGGGKVYIHIEAGSGEGIDPKAPTMSAFNRDADGEPSLRATELWYEREWLDGGIRLRLGKVDLTTDFDSNDAANDETTQFLSALLCNNSVIAFPDDNGFGGMLWLSPHGAFSLGFAIAGAGADGEKVFSSPFVMAEMVFSPRIGRNQGNYRLHAWRKWKRHEKIQDPDAVGVEKYGAGVSFDQQFFGALTLFARGGVQRRAVSRAEYAGSAGIEIMGVVRGREEDALGLAAGMIRPGTDGKKDSRTSGVRPGDELHAEVYSRLSVNEYLSLSPDVQWVRNPNGDADALDIWVFGLRAQIAF